ncbi:AMIN domain-containing protein [Desulfonema magnum]|uniref:AMIN domain-containing protein n=1 Tax=Desulfonema magnum TaxID=45655 RepID=UPI001A9A8176|nr:AMIN domain-containing protein [Desulfonema magnum]
MIYLTFFTIICCFFLYTGSLPGAVLSGAEIPRKREARVEIVKDIDMENLKEVSRVIILADQPVQNYQASFLNRPLRFVVDLTGNWKNSGDAVLNMKDDMIRSIRVGEHPDKLRVVMDLKNNGPFSPIIEEYPRGFSIIMEKQPACLRDSAKEEENSTEKTGRQRGADDDRKHKRILKAVLPRSPENGEFSLLISADGPVQDYTSFFLTDETPPKFVADLAGKWKNPGKSVFKVESDITEAVRVGEHPDFLRVVMDLRLNEPLSPFFRELPEGLMITVKRKVVVTD